MKSTPILAASGAAGRLAAFLLLIPLVAMAPFRAVAQEFDFHAPASADDPAAAAIMRDLAVRLVPVYQEPDPYRYLANLSALQMAARNYRAAAASRDGATCARPVATTPYRSHTASTGW